MHRFLKIFVCFCFCLMSFVPLVHVSAFSYPDPPSVSFTKPYHIITYWTSRDVDCHATYIVYESDAPIVFKEEGTASKKYWVMASDGSNIHQIRYSYNTCADYPTWKISVDELSDRFNMMDPASHRSIVTNHDIKLYGTDEIVFPSPQIPEAGDLGETLTAMSTLTIRNAVVIVVIAVGSLMVLWISLNLLLRVLGIFLKPSGISRKK